jgi:hypothetical protein
MLVFQFPINVSGYTHNGAYTAACSALYGGFIMAVREKTYFWCWIGEGSLKLEAIKQLSIKTSIDQ